ncbi:cation efflux family-domain-containing protein [Lipomyces japonicus]|uniref:cation efflux family-domain-containing protein n=1 Tax=Lipomyces japonicus TaxID=56871 RepID=UPI0034CE7D5C
MTGKFNLTKFDDVKSRVLLSFGAIPVTMQIRVITRSQVISPPWPAQAWHARTIMSCTRLSSSRRFSSKPNDHHDSASSSSSSPSTESSHDHHTHTHSQPQSSHFHLPFHSHTHTHDTTLLLSKDVTDPAVRITKIGLWVNLGMALAKGIGGYVFNSKSLMADAGHALSDLLSDFLTLATVRVATRAPTARFPNGFGKVEALGSLGVSAMLVLAGVGMGVSAAESLYTHFFTMESIIDNAAAAAAAATGHHGHAHDESWLHSLLAHSHSNIDGPPNIHAAWLAAGSIAIKEWLFQATMKIANDKQSTVLVANAWHHRVDCLTSVVALTAITGSHLCHWDWLDPAGGLLVSGVILQAGVSSARQAVAELIDQAASQDILDSARDAATDAVSDTVDTVVSATNDSITAQVLDVRAIKSGPVVSVAVDLRVGAGSDESTASSGVSLEQANRLAANVRNAVASQVSAARLITVRTFDQHERDVSYWVDKSQK